MKIGCAVYDPSRMGPLTPDDCPGSTHSAPIASAWMVFTDPSANAIELKVYRDESTIFGA
jgi:hypothetical protein